MQFIPAPLWNKMKVWAGKVRNGQIILNLCDGKVATFKLIEHGRVKAIQTQEYG